MQWDGQPSPMAKLLNEPTKTNVPIPGADFVMRRITGDYEVFRCDLYSFPIVYQQKRLDVFKWATNWRYSGDGVRTQALVFELNLEASSLLIFNLHHAMVYAYLEPFLEEFGRNKF